MTRFRQSKHSGLYQNRFRCWYRVFRNECKRVEGPFTQKHSLMDFTRNEDGSMTITPHFGVIAG